MSRMLASCAGTRELCSSEEPQIFKGTLAKMRDSSLPMVAQNDTWFVVVVCNMVLKKQVITQRFLI